MRDLTIAELKKEHEAGDIVLSDLYWYEHALKRFGDKMFNHDAKRVNDMPDCLGGQVFWRSNSPWKEPGGRIVSAKKARRIGGDNYFATQKAIEFELRVYWQKGMGEHITRYAAPKGWFGKQSVFNNPVITELQNEMDSFVIDFAVCDGREWILEMNPPEASGIYGSPVWPSSI